MVNAPPTSGFASDACDVGGRSLGIPVFHLFERVEWAVLAVVHVHLIHFIGQQHEALIFAQRDDLGRAQGGAMHLKRGSR